MTKDEIIASLSDIPQASRLIRDVVVKNKAVYLTLLINAQDRDSSSGLKETVDRRVRECGADEVHIRSKALGGTEWERMMSEGDQPASAVDEPDRTAPPQADVCYIAVTSGKGGVGKSTVTLNLAYALARSGKRVGIIDADIYGFSIPDMLGLNQRPQVRGQKVVPLERDGIKLISMGFFVEDNSPVIWRGPMLGRMLKSFLFDVDWGKLDYLLLDLPPGTGDVALDIHQWLPQAKEIIVTTPHKTAAHVAARAGTMAIQTKHEIVGVIENMSYLTDEAGQKSYIFGRGGGEALSRDLNTELLAQIPLQPSADADKPQSVFELNSGAGRIYAELAGLVCAKTG
ncbi:Mrp/NBP35 family ATP-binding protein [Paenibacillus beijingensis]|uniref:Iron-sulfur cluster carrier protein n=1 Tax=Paenibacillus beijingensis TaxID=1126833 RepID=A0A0D5NEU7_9BACL|nr:Mrp/NBP35 family ATP-binding protein [Paenibacillus beijingensis]AJY73756.1 hypothetical protein VN24_02815 [Paenibacillus beijingensis]